MNDVLEQASHIVGESAKALVFHQVLVGLGFIILGLVLCVIVWVLFNKFHVSIVHPTAFVVYTVLLVSIVASFIYGGLHVINPEYYALLQLKGMFN